MTTANDARADTELWLIRHGESAGNAGGIFQGQHEYPLSPRGREQAAAVAKRLAATSFAALYCSDLDRAEDTAAAIAGAVRLKPVVEPRLREIDTGTWSGLTAPQIQARFPDEWASWMAKRDPAHRRGGGESYVDVEARMLAVIGEIAERHVGGRVLIVAHGGCLGAYVAHLMEIPLSALWRCALVNTAVTRVLPFAPPPPGMATHTGRLVTYNDTTHLTLALTEHAT
ncbi:MAG TPA: histidine phosphatase family protein [Planctomycetota bacterium]|nr:histidine phosphatase family protein [Planctomycetota bacterium]